MKITLIFAPYQVNITNKDLTYRDEGIGKIPPLSLLQVAAILEQMGVTVQIIDQENEGLSGKQVLERIRQFAPDLLGFTLTTYSFHPVLEWIRLFKQETGLPILVGGAHVGLYPAETMTHSEIDYAIVGEAEIPLPQLISALQEGRTPTGLASVCYRDAAGHAIIDTTRQIVHDLDNLPYPARHLIDNTIYSNILTRQHNFTAIMSTRGCPYRCTFCDQHRPKYRWRSAESFVAEVRYNLEKFNIREFDIYDSTFTANRRRVLEICRLLEQENLHVGFTVRSTLMAVNIEMLDALKRAGCHTIMYGVETSNEDILKRMKKYIPRERILEMIRHTHSIGIQVLGFFMFGFPGETTKTIRDTIQFSLDLPLDYAQYTVLWPFPDTEIYGYYRDNSNFGDYWARYTLDPTCSMPIALVDTEVTREEATNLVGEAYRRFYFRPRIFWRRLTSIRSTGELRRLWRGGMGIIKSTLRDLYGIEWGRA
ncbi:MAG: radical SAM protein [Magnetococcales bacterium]|nr:radical SAM protein [Magnetococcales bacterium]